MQQYDGSGTAAVAGDVGTLGSRAATGLSIEGLSVHYKSGDDRVAAVDDVSLTVPAGSLTVLLGPSGCGKSTILNSVAGLIRPSEGRIAIGDQTVFDRATRTVLPPNRRHLGMVFQSYALWPHKSVRENVAYPIRRSGSVSKEQLRARVGAALNAVRCGHLDSRFPGELSGGQQQRVALARAIANEPALILFDEPLSNLDAALRRTVRDELIEFHDRLGFTGLYVTHDQVEALSLASTVVMMADGRIVQQGEPEAVFGRPTSAYVASFLGAQLIPGRLTARSGNHGRVETALGTFDASHVVGDGDGSEVVVAVHPSDIALRSAADGSAAPVVQSIRFLGAYYECFVTSGDVRVECHLAAHGVTVERGQEVELSIAPERVHVYAE